MRISQAALNLLLEGKFSELQNLSYEELFTPENKQEILNIFLNDTFTNTTQSAIQDYVTLQNIKKPCVVSSGHIYSESILEELFKDAGVGGVACPVSRANLLQNLGNQGKSYVFLPRLDSIFQCFDVLRSINQKVSIGEEASCNEKKALFELKASNGRVKLIFNFEHGFEHQAKLLSDYLEFMLPKGKVQAEWGSYSMDTKKFGRCWLPINKRSVMLSCWYPTSSDVGNRRTFSELHINELMQSFSAIFNLAIEGCEQDSSTRCALSDLDAKTFVVLMEEIPVSFDQALISMHRFLRYMERVAKTFRFDVCDHALSGNKKPAPSRDVRNVFFASRNSILTQSSIQTSTPARNIN